MGTNGTEERDAYIRAQYYAGRSAIELGAGCGLSRSQIHRILAAGPRDDYEDDETLGRLIRMDDLGDVVEDPDGCTAGGSGRPIDDGCALTPPLTFCGIDFTDDPHGTERVIDARGRQAPTRCGGTAGIGTPTAAGTTLSGTRCWPIWTARSRPRAGGRTSATGAGCGPESAGRRFEIAPSHAWGW